MKSLSPRNTGGSDPSHEFQELIHQAVEIRRDLIDLTNESLDLLEHVHSSQRESAVNLLHYVALRSRDLRSFQMRLARLGLSSLGRAESHVLAAVDAVLEVLHRAVGREWKPEKSNEPPVDLERGRHLLGAHTPRPAWVCAS